MHFTSAASVAFWQTTLQYLPCGPFDGTRHLHAGCAHFWTSFMGSSPCYGVVYDAMDQPLARNCAAIEACRLSAEIRS